MASLPAELQSEAEQLQIIEELERQNQAAGERLAKAQAEAGLPPFFSCVVCCFDAVLFVAELWQKRVSAVLKEASTRQLRSTASASAQATPTVCVFAAVVAVRCVLTCFFCAGHGVARGGAVSQPTIADQPCKTRYGRRSVSQLD